MRVCYLSGFNVALTSEVPACSSDTLTMNDMPYTYTYT